MKLKYFVYILIGLFALSVVSNVKQFLEPPKIITKTILVDTTKIRDSLTAIIKAQLTSQLKPTIIYNTKRIIIPSNVDSIYEAAKEYWLKKIGSANKDTLNYYNYSAIADTAVKDSSGWAYVRFNSRIPVDPEGYFNINLGWTNKTVTNTIKEITVKHSFWDSFNYSIQAGFGEGLITKRFDFYYGIGISYNLKPLF